VSTSHVLVMIHSRELHHTIGVRPRAAVSSSGDTAHPLGVDSHSMLQSPKAVRRQTKYITRNRTDSLGIQAMLPATQASRDSHSRLTRTVVGRLAGQQWPPTQHRVQIRPSTPALRIAHRRLWRHRTIESPRFDSSAPSNSAKPKRRALADRNPLHEAAAAKITASRETDTRVDRTSPTCGIHVK